MDDQKSHKNLKISIITATFNSEKTILNCIKSVEKQSLNSFEHIIVDGMSSDKTLSIINRFRNNIDKLIVEHDEGIYDALNKGIKKSTGEIIGFLHSDDTYANQNVLKDVARIFKSNPYIDAVYGDLNYIKNNTPEKIVRRWKSSNFKLKMIKYGWMPPHPSLFVKSKLYKKIGYFDTSFKISADYLSILQLFSQRNFKAIYLPKVLVNMSTGGASNKSLTAILKKSNEDWKALRKSHFNILNSIIILIFKNIRKISQFF